MHAPSTMCTRCGQQLGIVMFTTVTVDEGGTERVVTEWLCVECFESSGGTLHVDPPRD